MPTEKTPEKKKRETCRSCGRVFAYSTIAAHPTFPFCSERCQQAELNAWYTDRYVLDRPLDPEADLANATDAEIERFFNPGSEPEFDTGVTWPPDDAAGDDRA